MRAVEVRAFEVRAFEVRAFEVRAFEVRAFEVRAFEVRAFVQPARAGLQSGAAGLVVMAPWGKEVQVVKTAYVPGDTTIGLLDRATFDGDDYIVVALSPNYAADELVMVEAQLAPAMPGMG